MFRSLPDPPPVSNIFAAFSCQNQYHWFSGRSPWQREPIRSRCAPHFSTDPGNMADHVSILIVDMARTSFYPVWHIWKSLKTENNPTLGFLCLPSASSLKVMAAEESSSRFLSHPGFCRVFHCGGSSSQCPFVPEGGRGQIFLCCALLHSIWRQFPLRKDFRSRPQICRNT